MEGNMVYLDYAATTPFNKEVIKTHEQLLQKYFYNADSIYSQGIEVNRLLEKSRSLIAGMLHVKDEEITSAKIRLLEHGEKSNIFRGKNQFDFMTKYIEQLYKGRKERMVR